MNEWMNELFISPEARDFYNEEQLVDIQSVYVVINTHGWMVTNLVPIYTSINTHWSTIVLFFSA